jgi:hypothetical protein
MPHACSASTRQRCRGYCAPEQRKIDSPCEGLYCQFDRLPSLGDRLDDSWREKPQRNEPPHRATVDSFPSCEFADGTQSDGSVSASRSFSERWRLSRLSWTRSMSSPSAAAASLLDASRSIHV